MKNENVGIANYLPVLIWMADTEKSCYYFNDKWLLFTGRTLEQEFGNGWAEGVHPDDMERCLAIYISKFDKREDFVMEYRLKRHDGVYRWIIDYGIPRYNEKSEFVGYVGTCMDINDKKELEENLVKNEERFKSLFRDHSAIMLLIDFLTGEIVDANKTAIGFYGYSYTELCSMNIADINTLSKEKVYTEYQKARQGEKNEFVFQHRLANNELRFVEVSSSPIQFGNRTVLFSIIQDITQRKIIENEIIKTNERFSYATQATSDGIYEWDIISNKTYWSDGYKKMYEYDVDNNVGDYSFWYNKIEENYRKKVLDSLTRAIEDKVDRWTEEYKLLKGNGEYVEVRDTAIIIKDDQGKAVRLVGALKDITQQKKEELQLRLFESVIENANDVIIVTEAEPLAIDGPKIIYVNEAIKRATGYSREELIGKTPKILQGAETDPAIKKIISENLRRWQPVQADILNYKKTGEKFWNRLFISPVANEKGWVSHWVSIQRDVSEEKKDEAEKAKRQEEKIIAKAIEKSERRYAQLVNSIYEIMFTTDNDGNWTFLNNAWERTMEYSVEECIGVPFFNYLHKDDVAKNFALFTPLIERKKKYCRHNIRYVTKSGMIKWIEVYAVLIIDENNETIGTSGTLRDITIEKKNEHYYELFSKNAKDLICVHNPDTTFLYVSPSVKEILGYSLEEILKKTVVEIIHPDDVHLFDEVKSEYAIDFKSNGIFTKEIIARYKKKDGRYTWMESSLNVFFDEYSYEDKLVSTSKVIDKRIHAEQEILATLEKEKKLNELKSKFISITSHEFKTPLTVIKSTVEILKAYITKGKTNIDYLNSLSLIGNEVDSLTQLINDVLVLEKLNSKKVNYNPEPVDLLELIRSILEKFSYAHFENRKADLLCTSPERKVLLDKNLIEKVLNNLISNAFKYSEGNPNPVVEVIFLEKEVKVKIKDFGIGIPETDKDQLFSSFFRGKNAANIEGTGLGLNIVKNFVEMHNGSIEIFSKENVGTEVIISLP